MTAARLPSDNTFVDKDGRYLSHWRPILEAASRLSSLTPQQQETIVQLLDTLTRGDGPIQLNADGTLSVDQQDVSVALAAFNAGVLAGVQPGINGSVPINAKSGLRLEKAENSVDLVGVDYAIRPPVVGGFYGMMGDVGDATSTAALVADRIYATPFPVRQSTTLSAFGPVSFASASINTSMAICLDNDMRPGKTIWTKSYTSVTLKTTLETGERIGLSAGNYWLLFKPSTATSLFKVVPGSTTGTRLGVIINPGSSDIVKLIGIYRDASGSTFLADETPSVWSPAINGDTFPYLLV